MMALDHWRTMAAKQRDDTVDQPLDNGVLGPQVMQLRPRFILSLGLTRLLNGLFDTHWVSAQLIAVVAAPYLTG